MKLVFIITALLMTVINFSQAHEGHNKTPGSQSAPHGGQIKGTDHLYLELVSSGTGFKLYPLDHDMKAVPVKDVKVSATMSLPKKSKSEVITLTSEADAFVAVVDAKGAHRYIVNLTLTHEGKTEKIKFNVEP